MTRPAVRPLADVRKLTGLCEDCGRRIVWDRHRIAREQLRRGFRTPEELGSRLFCEGCVDRPGAGRNVSITVVYEPPAAGQYSDSRLLTELHRIASTCSDCGYRVELDQADLKAMSDEVKTVEELWRQAFCTPCRAQGSTTPHVLLEIDPALPVPGQTPGNPKWSKAEVFGEDRSDPFPLLARRSRFATA